MQSVALVLWPTFEQLEEEDWFRSWAFGVARYEVFARRREIAWDRLVLSEDVLQAVAGESAASETRLAAQPRSVGGRALA